MSSISPFSSLAPSLASNESISYERQVDDFINELPSCGWSGNSARVRELILNNNVLKLNHTTLTKVPDSIGALVSLQEVDLSETKLTELPESLKNLKQLRELDVSCTHITDLPDWIGNLSKLECLSVVCTKVTCLPDSIGNLNSLRSLFLAITKITSLPRVILKFQEQLHNLHIFGCPIVEQSDSTTLGLREIKEIFGNIVI